MQDHAVDWMALELPEFLFRVGEEEGIVIVVAENLIHSCTVGGPSVYKLIGFRSVES